MTGYRIQFNSFRAKLAAQKLRSARVAMVWNKTILLYGCSLREFVLNEKWFKHECCHLTQIESEGWLVFLFKYIGYSIRYGYYQNPYEVAARAAEQQPLPQWALVWRAALMASLPKEKDALSTNVKHPEDKIG